MKYYEMKKSLKKKAIALREIKIGHKEAQRVLWFNSFGTDGRHISEYINESRTWNDVLKNFTPELMRRLNNAEEAYDKCCFSISRATQDYRARHIAYSLFRGKTPEQIENNYYEGKWDGYLMRDINNHLERLRLDNPVEEEYKIAV